VVVTRGRQTRVMNNSKRLLLIVLLSFSCTSGTGPPRDTAQQAPVSDEFLLDLGVEFRGLGGVAGSNVVQPGVIGLSPEGMPRSRVQLGAPGSVPFSGFFLSRSSRDVRARSSHFNRALGSRLSGAGGLSLQASRTTRRVTSWKRSKLLPNSSRLSVGSNKTLPLKGMQVSVRFDGFRARVLIDYYYLNTHDRQLEGTFQLRLPGGASPYYLAFGNTAYAAKTPRLSDAATIGRIGIDPNSILRDRTRQWRDVKEARMVPRKKAARAYTETVRRRVDPALMEWSGAGVFSARIFPIQPGKLIRVVLGYDLDLTAVGEDREYRLVLPKGVPQVAVYLLLSRIQGVGVSVTPGAVKIGAGHYRFTNPKANEIRLRLTKLGPTLLTGGGYFAAAFRPELPREKIGGSPRAVFLVDTSLSSNPDKFNIWLELMQAILARNRDSLKQFAVLFFNVDTHWWQPRFVENTAGKVAKVAQYCRKLALEGATDLGAALGEAVRPAWTTATGHDLFLLSDAAATWGRSDAYALSSTLRSGKSGPLFGYTTGMTGTDSRLLAALARETGGAIFSVVGAQEISKAATAHRSRPWRVVGVALGGGSDLLLAGRPQSIYPGQNLLLVGRGKPDKEAAIELTLRRGGQTRRFSTPLRHRLVSRLAPRLFGAIAVGQLEELSTATQAESRAFAIHFRVVGRSCSLLMLDREADYRRYKIKPEEEAFIVERTSVSKLIARTLASLHKSLGDPKLAFLAWLARLEKMPGVGLRLSASLKLAIRSLPNSAFEIDAGLRCTEQTWAGMPATVRKALRSQRLDYDAMQAEASRRSKAHGAADGLKALSSLVENLPGDLTLARDVGLQALRRGLGGQAYHTFRRVAVARPWEPQNYHALARCLLQLGRIDLALAFFEIGVNGRWDARFGEVNAIMAMEYRNLLQRIVAGKLPSRLGDYAKARLLNLAKSVKIERADLVVIINWNTDRSDVDLHVTEPSGETCYYSHAQTSSGGRLTRDVTQGYGPEMYVLRQAPPGTYRLKVRYYSATRSRASSRTKVFVTIYRDWGGEQEQVTRKTVVLAEDRREVEVAQLKLGG